MSVWTVRETAQRAVEHARSGGGPVLRRGDHVPLRRALAQRSRRVPAGGRARQLAAARPARRHARAARGRGVEGRRLDEIDAEVAAQLERARASAASTRRSRSRAPSASSRTDRGARPDHAEAVRLDGGGDHPALAEGAGRRVRARRAAGRDRDGQGDGRVRGGDRRRAREHPRARRRLRAHRRADRDARERRDSTEASRRAPRRDAPAPERARPHPSPAAARWSSASRCTTSRARGPGGRITVRRRRGRRPGRPARAAAAPAARARSRSSSSRRRRRRSPGGWSRRRRSPTFMVTIEIDMSTVAALAARPGGRRRR